MSETNSILILAFVTIVLSAYSLVVTGWWERNRDRLTNRLSKPWYGLFSLVSSLIFIAAVIVAPMCLLGYFMDDIKLVKNIGTYGRGAVLLTWSVPLGIYIAILVFRRSRPKK
jgi:hypothetical protein